MYEELVMRLRFKAGFSAYDSVYDEAADTIEELSMKLHGDEAAIVGMKREIERMVRAEKPRWIPVTEWLPEEDGMYLVHGTWSASGRKVTDTCEFFVHDGYFRAAWNFDVSHWQPLPEPPKEKE